MNVKPLRDKIIVKPERRLKSSIFIQTAEADSLGEVVAVGPEAEAEGLKVGDKIAFGHIAKDYKDEYLKFEEYVENDVRYLKMSWQDVACIIED
jgi:co-chaperonin GroES (HSP10)